MIAVAPAATAQRRAALLIHALPQSDQQWLLQSLPAHQRGPLAALLEELRELEIAPEECFLRPLLNAPQAQPVGAVERLERLTPAQIAVLVQVLRQEPPQLAAALLAARSWPWTQAVLPALSLVSAANRPPTACLQQALYEAVMRRLDAVPAPSPRRGWQRLFRFHEPKARS